MTERGAKTVPATSKMSAARHVSSLADVSDANDVRRLAAEAGDVDILINNAGIYRFAPTFDTTDADFDDQINTNLRAPYILVQKLVPGMVERGHGTVINVTTVAASDPGRGRGHLRRQQGRPRAADRSSGPTSSARWGVRVNAAAPGPTQTPGTAEHSTGPDRGPRPPPRALGRTSRTPTRSPHAVTFLASPRRSYVNGAVLTIGGGAQSIKAA